MGEVTRPLAQTRLQRAVERALGENGVKGETGLDTSAIRQRISVVSQEKRFLLLVFLMKHDKLLTSQEIAEGISDSHYNVVRNLHVFVSEKLVLPKRDEVTRIVRYRVNREALSEISRFFAFG